MAGDPTLEAERELQARGHRLVAGCDEVGRGALAGPVTVGLVAVDPAAAAPLPGVRDSKLLSAGERLRLAPLIKEWAVAWGVGHASAGEIDRLGLVPALRLAGLRAWRAATATGAGPAPGIVLLDGNLDWLSTPRQAALFEDPEDPPRPAAGGAGEEDGSVGPDVPVQVRIKADLTCLSVAAASVLAKVERDGLMAGFDAEAPGYGWAVNKGYGTASHRAAIASLGASDHHRRSWRLTGSHQAQ